MRRFILVAFLSGGCASLPPVPPEEAARQHCLVCRDRRDFDCIVVEKSPRAPHADYEGRTLYFCGENCRVEFARNPGRYWPAR